MPSHRSVREEVDEEMARNRESRLWYVRFKARWLREHGIIDVRKD